MKPLQPISFRTHRNVAIITWNSIKLTSPFVRVQSIVEKKKGKALGHLGWVSLRSTGLLIGLREVSLSPTWAAEII